jgi:DNA-binding MarR family transcriptional regulator
MFKDGKVCLSVEVLQALGCMSGSVKLLVYMIERLDTKTGLIFIQPKQVMKDLEIKSATYHLWIRKLEQAGLIKKLNPYTYKILF